MKTKKPVAMAAKAALVTPNPGFCNHGMHSGVWKRRTVTSCWGGELVELKATEESGGTCCCLIIRVGDEFMVARDFGDPRRKLADYARACS